MMNQDNSNLEIKRVPFLGTELMAARDVDGQIWAGVRWMCNGIGLSQGQTNREINKIGEDEVLKEGHTKFGMGVFDPHNPTIALKLDYVPLWLAKISITPAMKVEHPELAETLKQYQLKAKDVLAAAFLPPAAVKSPQAYPRKATSVGEVYRLMHELRAIMKDNDQTAEKIAEMAEILCDQFDIHLPSDFVRRNPFQQLALFGWVLSGS